MEKRVAIVEARRDKRIGEEYGRVCVKSRTHLAKLPYLEVRSLTDQRYALTDQRYAFLRKDHCLR